EEEAEKSKAKKDAAAISWILYDVYKKSHAFMRGFRYYITPTTNNQYLSYPLC
ncbi:MAG: hypothetical protein US39_C0017G0001, partial [Microgenomates group bacterium GW2011_GWC1_37_12b]